MVIPPQNLQQFIALLESEGELSRISVPVDPAMEIAFITDRVCKQPEGGSALLFENPVGSHFPVATNLFGSVKRVHLALGVDDLDELTDRLRSLLNLLPGTDFTALDGDIAALREFSRFVPQRSAEHDPAMMRMSQPDLTLFPFLQSWPGDGGAAGYPRYLTLPQIFTRDPDGGTPNCGIYRVQVRGARECAVQWKIGSGAACHAEQWHRRGRPMPVAIVLGGAPATLFSAMFPLPGNLDELTFAGFLRGLALRTVECCSVPLQVPADTEVVIEGFVTDRETVMEGPFGNHTGFYSPAAPASLMRVTAISHRSGGIIPATVVGAPPMEDCRMALAWERLLLAFLQKLIPLVTDIHFPPEWIFHQSAIISVENSTPDMVRSTVTKLWALPWFATAPVLIIVDAGFEPPDLKLAAWKCINIRDLSASLIHDTTTTRIAVDATAERSIRTPIAIDEKIAALVRERWNSYGLA